MLTAQAEALGLRRRLAVADLSVQAAEERASAMEKSCVLMKAEITELSTQLAGRVNEEAHRLEELLGRAEAELRAQAESAVSPLIALWRLSSGIPHLLQHL